MVPKVAGRSGQWIEAEGRGSAAGTQSICLLYIFWMVEDVVRCQRYVIARK